MALLSDDLYKALQAAGVFDPADTSVRRFVIDARVGQPVRMFVQRVGDQALATVLPAELVQLESGNIFEPGPATRSEVGEPETVRESELREAETGTHLTQGEPQTVDNG